MLLDAGADPDYKTNDGYTPLIVAASYDYRELVSTLIRYGADVNLANNHGYSSLHLASWEGYMEVMDILLEAGCHTDTPTSDKNTPLALACHGNHYNALEKLMAMGCNVNNKDKDDDTPLLYATFNGCVKSVKLLIENGADPNFANSKNTTPLWNAVFKNHQEIVQLLIQEGVDLDIATRGIDQHSQTEYVVLIFANPKTPVEGAFQLAHNSIAKILVLAGADLRKEQWLWEGCYSNALSQDRDTREWLLQRAFTPFSLKRQCRTYLKRRFGTSIKQKAHQFEIPTTLRDFLLLKYL